MQRFTPKEKSTPLWKRLLLPLVFTTAILFCFSAAVNSVSQSTSEEQQENLEQAIRRSIVQCYITEGSYPESLDYLKSNYPVFYDENAFFVDYQPIGENIMPEITIIKRKSTRAFK